MACQLAHPSAGTGGSAARRRGRWRATRGLDRSSGSRAVTMCSPGGRISSSGAPLPEPAQEIGLGGVGDHHVEAAIAAGIQPRDRRGRVSRRALLQGQQRQLAAAALARLRAQAAGPVQHRRHHAVRIQPEPGAVAGAVAAGDDPRVVRPVRGRAGPRRGPAARRGWRRAAPARHGRDAAARRRCTFSPGAPDRARRTPAQKSRRAARMHARHPSRASRAAGATLPGDLGIGIEIGAEAASVRLCRGRSRSPSRCAARCGRRPRGRCRRGSSASSTSPLCTTPPRLSRLARIRSG